MTGPAAYPEDMTGLRVFTLVSGIICALGGALSVLGVVATLAVGFDSGKNIGAALLLTAGVPFACVGGALLLGAGLITLLRRRPHTRGA